MSAPVHHCVPECRPDAHIASVVPRRAGFDDLRVGQWVAWVGRFGPGSGVIRSKGPHGFTAEGPLGDVTLSEEYEVTILRDAPAPPVTVQRADYDALKSLVGSYTSTDSLTRAARALIDNADTRDTADDEDRDTAPGWADRIKDDE